MQTKLTVGMIKFLDSRNGQDLIKSAHDFRIAYGLSYEETSYLIQKWMDIPTI